MAEDYWEKNGIKKPQAIVVCAACKTGDVILCGARHWDAVMRHQLAVMQSFGSSMKAHLFEQGFINQFGEFLTRKEALQVVKESGQPFDVKRNGSDTELFSEGLY